MEEQNKNTITTKQIAFSLYILRLENPIKSWKCKESEVRYYQSSDDIKFVDTLGNTVWIKIYSGTVIMEKI